mgnify:FL=1
MVCYLEYQYLQCIQCHESEHRYSKYKNGYNVYYDDFYESIYHGNTGQKKAQTVIKKITILPCIPSVTYTYRF